MAAELQPKYPNVKIIPTKDSKGAAQKSQLIVTETTAAKPFVDKSWLTPGCGLVSMASNEVDLDVVRSADVICIDYWKQMITYNGKAVAQLYNNGEIDENGVSELGDLCWVRRPAVPLTISSCSLPPWVFGALDIMIGYQLYQNAAKMGIGTKVKLWDKPLWE